MATSMCSENGYGNQEREDLDKVPQAKISSMSTDTAMTLSAQADPVLAELWDNEKDAIYDKV